MDFPFEIIASNDVPACPANQAKMYIHVKYFDFSHSLCSDSMPVPSLSEGLGPSIYVGRSLLTSLRLLPVPVWD